MFRRKRHLGHGSGREAEQLNLVVITGYAIGSQEAAKPATVNKRPLPFRFQPHADRLHFSSAPRPPVSRTKVHVKTPEALRAVIAVFGSPSERHYGVATVGADEDFIYVDHS